MHFRKATLVQKKPIFEDTYIIRLSVEGDSPFLFKPGQYVYLKNQKFSHPEEIHPFSIASSPTDSSTLEFCIRTNGDWTDALLELPLGSTLSLSDAQGSFTWDTTILHGVFLLGGLGISPIMSMLRFMIAMTINPSTLIMLYGNRTPKSVAYRQELLDIQQKLPMLKIVNIYSHLSADDPNLEYKGFITRELIDKEVNLTLEPTFYYLGPPIFINKMEKILDELQIPSFKRKKEDFISLSPNS